MTNNDTLADVCRALGVKYTRRFSQHTMSEMPFRTLFGFSRILSNYGIESEGIKAEAGDGKAADSLPLPCCVDLKGIFKVLVARDSDSYTLLEEGRRAIVPRDTLLKQWSGYALLLHADDKAEEPCWKQHRYADITKTAKRVLFWACCGFLLILCIITGGWWKSVADDILMASFIAGLYVSFLLTLKSLHIKSKHANKICSVIEAEGCSSVLATKASSFFGIFGWSDVGVTYFGVGLATMLLFPENISWLAWINAVCVPFSFWSVWYQKYRAKAWCTLCLTVQALLWLQFFCNLFGSNFGHVPPFSWALTGLLAIYVATLMAVSGITSFLKAKFKGDE